MDRDEQDDAEAFDEDMIDGDDLTADHTNVDFPPDQLRGVPYGDADVTDESFADRSRQEEPEVTPRDIDVRDADGAG